MGWTGEYHDGRPNTAQLNALLADWTKDVNTQIIDRSGWRDFNRRIWLLLDEPGRAHLAHQRVIILVLVDYSNNMVMDKDVDETMGPFDLDCPMRLINAADQYPAPSQTATLWRERVRAHHALRKEQNALLRQIPLRTRTEVVLQHGETVPLRFNHHRGRTTMSYLHAGDDTWYRLVPEITDPAASLTLWASNQSAPQEVAA